VPSFDSRQTSPETYCTPLVLNVIYVGTNRHGTVTGRHQPYEPTCRLTDSSCCVWLASCQIRGAEILGPYSQQGQGSAVRYLRAHPSSSPPPTTPNTSPPYRKLCSRTEILSNHQQRVSNVIFRSPYVLKRLWALTAKITLPSSKPHLISEWIRTIVSYI
jgi:hypothetical protein